MISARGLLGSIGEPRADAGAAAPASGRIPDLVLFLIPLVLATAVYFPTTGNYFFADDFIHLFRVRNEGLLPYLLIPRGGHLLITSNAIFYVMDLLFGAHPEPYYWLALLTHLVNVGLLFAVIRQFTLSAYLACFGAALWGISPLNESALGWYSVFGQVLVGSVMLVMLYQLGRLAAGQPPPRHAPLLWCALLLAASTSFGIGIGLTLAFPVAAFVFLPPSPTRTRIVVVFAVLAVVVTAFYFALSQITTAVYRPRTAPIFYESDPLTNLLMLSLLVGYGIASLVVSQVIPQLDFPSVTAYAVIGLFTAGLVATLVAAPRTVRRQLLACLVLSLGCYGMIVVGRAAYFAMAGRPQAFIRPGRYHYAAPIPLAIALCVMLACAGRRFRLGPSAKNGLLAGWILLAAFGHYWFAKPIDHHFYARRETTTVLAAIRQAIDAASDQGAFITNKRFQSVGPIYSQRQDMFPGWAGVFVIFYPENRVDGKPVFFLTSDAEALAAAQEGRRTATLVVEAPAPE